ncbi:hypothetical protein BZB76_2441 [Actinomadura pelletieri DSM 43383]|uniref:Uncharacterized protein n=1 Tax=Actinomadura pelletieri DSM 43383 TaxID=1120940 RepID=A0A495QU60_9ACTN|nr:hypothetical protein [Actinomadura pelletieri]RKS77072.1 hypothetical protein BZB76_2441 [Actinomadura pelletieri DSM 43383]
MTTVEGAFRWARIHAVRHMAACEQAGLRWGETSITEIVTSHAAKAVTVVPFTQQAEALSGADWIWWWVDGRGAYGMLIQAKRATVSWGKWTFDFDYPGGTGAQRSTLMSAAATLGLLPAYALYLGTGDYRSWEPCTRGHRSGRCIECVKRSVSLMPALLAEALVVDDAASTYERSVALEELWAPSTTGALIIPAVQEQLAPELLDFLSTRQDGSRAVTRAMIDRVLRARFGQFSAPARGDAEVRRDGAHDGFGPVFGRMPHDTGHWGMSYFKHMLTPLLHAPPWYVLEVMSGDFDEDGLAAEMPANVAGIVIVRLPQNGRAPSPTAARSRG